MFFSRDGSRRKVQDILYAFSLLAVSPVLGQVGVPDNFSTVRTWLGMDGHPFFLMNILHMASIVGVKHLQPTLRALTVWPLLLLHDNSDRNIKIC